MELSRRHDDFRAHAAVDVHTQALELGAAIRSAGATGDASPAAEVRLDGASVARLYPVRIAAGIDDLDAQLVTEDARVVEKRLPSGKGVQVSPADADAMHPHQRVARHRCGARAVNGDEMAGLFERDLDHEHTPYTI